jgi:predicted Zn-dependent peptidase
MTSLLSRQLRIPVAMLVAVASVTGALAVTAKVPVKEFALDNGMKFLLVERPEATTVSAGWVAKVGSANEKPGITGISHLFEHMMFKGTRAIGTTDIERDLEVIEEQESIQERIRALYRVQQERWRRGDIDDPFAPENRPQELVELEREFQKLVDEQRELMVKNEFDKIYTEAGATGMNAGTNSDLTFYFITVPANKLELWFWMESDRLHNPVNREFYSERDVVHEERRLRTESTPTGRFDEQFDAMFWQSHPYSWPTVGWPSDLRMISKKQADDYYGTYYAANNLTAALVGNFDAEQVRQLAERYFGRLSRSPGPVPAVTTMEMPQLAEKRMAAECDCQPQVEIRYHTVPFMHRDSYALDVLGGLLSGRTGRLYKSLVLEDQIATSAFAGQSSNRWAGSFSMFAEAKGDANPEQLEQALYTELDRIVNEPIPAEELQKVKNGITANAFRRLESSFFLMLQLLIYDGLGDWGYINEWADRTLEVSAEDVKRVAGEYFDVNNRAAALYYRKPGANVAEVPEEIAALDDTSRATYEKLDSQRQQAVRMQLEQLRGVEDPETLRAGLAQLEARIGQVPPQFQDVMLLIEKLMQARLAELEAATSGSKGGE